MRRRALPVGLLRGLGRVVAWGCLKRCGLRPGAGLIACVSAAPRCRRGLDDASKGIKPEYSFLTELECEMNDGFC